MTVNLDLHTHSDASYDSITTIEEIFDVVEEHKELDGVAITDHNSVENIQKAERIAEDRGLIFVPGTEVLCEAGDVIGLGVKDEITPGMGLEDTINAIRERYGIAVIPHPFQMLRNGVSKKKLKEVDPDAVEIFNSRLITGYRNRQAKNYAEKTGIPKLCGSDAHQPELVGTAYNKINIDADASTKEILESIKKGEVETVNKKTPVTVFAKQIIFNNFLYRVFK